MVGEKEKIRKCPLCGGRMSEGYSALPFLIGEKIAVIKEVPAEICSDCGEPYMKSGIVDGIEAVLDKLEDIHAEVSIIHYEAA